MPIEKRKLFQCEMERKDGNVVVKMKLDPDFWAKLKTAKIDGKWRAAFVDRTQLTTCALLNTSESTLFYDGKPVIGCWFSNETATAEGTTLSFTELVSPEDGAAWMNTMKKWVHRCADLMYKQFILRVDVVGIIDNTDEKE